MNKWLVALTVMLPTLIEIIDTSVVNVSLDHIRGSLSASIDEATWTITSYLVSNAIIIPMTGWLSRLFGRKRYLIFSLMLFTASSLLCGSAWSLRALIFFRVLQEDLFSPYPRPSCLRPFRGNSMAWRWLCSG